MHPLQSAIELESPDIASLLTQYKDAINEPITSSGRRALHCAVLTKNTTIISEILKLGADWKAVDNDEATASHLLFQRSEKSFRQQIKIIDVLQTFFENGVDFNAKATKGETPLLLAAKYDMKEVAKFLIEHGADLNTSDSDGNTLAHILVKNEIETQLLLRRATTSSAAFYPGRKVKNVESAEQSRKKWKDADFLDELLTKGVDANRKNKADELPFQLALQYELLPMLPVLIRHTKDLQNINNSNGLIFHSVLKMVEVKEEKSELTPLDMSDDEDTVFRLIPFEPRVDFQIQTIVKMLRDRGLSAVDVDDNGDTPLIIAAKLYKFDIVEALLSQPTNVNLNDRVGNTALHYFAGGDLRNKVEVLRKLVSQGADLYTLNNEGHSPIHIAARCKNRIALRFFVEVGADFTKRAGNGDSVLHLMVKHVGSPSTDDSVIDLLMSQDCKVNALNDEGLTPLFVALQYCNAEVLPALIKKGAYVNCRHYSTGWTALHLAVQLTCSKDDTNIQSMFVRSLDLNCQVSASDDWRMKQLYQIVATLLRADAKVDVEDNNNRLPMFYCMKNNCPDAVTLMLQYGADFSEVGELSGRVEEYRKSKMFNQYLTKLRVAGWSTSKLTGDSGEGQQNTRHIKICSREVNKMKETVLRRSGKTVYEFACMSLKEKIRWVPRVLSDLKVECSQNFPHYRDILLGMGYEAKTTSFLRKRGRDALMMLTRQALPIITVEQIILGLSNASLRSTLAAEFEERKRRSTELLSGVARRRRLE